MNLFVPKSQRQIHRKGHWKDTVCRNVCDILEARKKFKLIITTVSYSDYEKLTEDIMHKNNRLNFISLQIKYLSCDSIKMYHDTIYHKS